MKLERSIFFLRIFIANKVLLYTDCLYWRSIWIHHPRERFLKYTKEGGSVIFFGDILLKTDLVSSANSYVCRQINRFSNKFKQKKKFLSIQERYVAVEQNGVQIFFLEKVYWGKVGFITQGRGLWYYRHKFGFCIW